MILLLRHFFFQSSRSLPYYSLVLLSHLLSSTKTKCRDPVIISACASKAKRRKSTEHLFSVNLSRTVRPGRTNLCVDSILHRKGLAVSPAGVKDISLFLQLSMRSPTFLRKPMVPTRSPESALGICAVLWGQVCPWTPGRGRPGKLDSHLLLLSLSEGAINRNLYPLSWWLPGWSRSPWESLGQTPQGSHRRLLGKHTVVMDLEWLPCVAILWPQTSPSHLPLSRLCSGHLSSPSCCHAQNENPPQIEKASLLVRRHWLGLFHFSPTRSFNFVFLNGLRVWLFPSSSLCEMSTPIPDLCNLQSV